MTFPFPFFSPSAIQPITISYRNNGLSLSSSSSLNWTSLNLGTEAADRIVIAGVHHNAATTVTGVTINGVAATHIVSDSPNMLASLWWALVPTGTTGVTLNVQYSASNSQHGLGVWSVYGADTTNPVYDTAFTAAAEDPASEAIDCPAGGGIIGFVRQVTNQGTYTWTGITEDFDVTTGATNVRISGAHDVFLTEQINKTIVADGIAAASMRMSLVSIKPK